jgi:hypothetical protein
MLATAMHSKAIISSERSSTSFRCAMYNEIWLSLSQAAIQDIVMSTRSLFSDTGRVDMIKDKIINALPLEMQNDVDFNKLFSDSLFNGLETEF